MPKGVIWPRGSKSLSRIDWLRHIDLTLWLFHSLVPLFLRSIEDYYYFSTTNLAAPPVCFAENSKVTFRGEVIAAFADNSVCLGLGAWSLLT
jgi:hypothetical protein